VQQQIFKVMFSSSKLDYKDVPATHFSTQQR